MNARVLFYIIIFIISDSFASHTVTDTKTKCKPYRAYLFWDICSNDKIFYTQRNAISKLIKDMPNGSLAHLTLIGAISEKTIDIFIGKSEWQKIISQLGPEQESMKRKIHFKHIKGAIEGTRGRHDSQEMATLIFFVLDKDSEIEKRERIKQYLEDKVTYVMFTGGQDLSFTFVSIATDGKHKFKLSISEDNDIGGLLEVVSKDSRLLCGTSYFWNSKTCHRCSFICGSDKSEYCRQECPYHEGTKQSIHRYCDTACSQIAGNMCTQQYIFLPILVICVSLSFVL
ncbi:uncharacterized protein LOC132728767 [Ruditapes philippinarum]|uniref:uncharacterized protein LOC132728767 n=1 Tax=Ruditapes philippinarum TaxID=129788 RepID=UPI00295A695E|nr:uncharacterized protein LOC132728767 [Ruditapes philippinarum]